MCPPFLPDRLSLEDECSSLDEMPLMMSEEGFEKDESDYQTLPRARVQRRRRSLGCFLAGGWRMFCSRFGMSSSACFYSSFKRSSRHLVQFTHTVTFLGVALCQRCFFVSYNETGLIFSLLVIINRSFLLCLLSGWVYWAMFILLLL